MTKILLTMSCVMLVGTGLGAIRLASDGMFETTRQEQRDADTLRSQAVSADPSL